MSQRKFAVIVTIIALAVSAIGAGLVIYKNKEDRKQENPETAVNPTNNPEDTTNQDVSIEPVEEDNGDEPPAPEEVTDGTEDWETYVDPEYGFQISYPGDWEVEDKLSTSLNDQSGKTIKLMINNSYVNIEIQPFVGQTSGCNKLLKSDYRDTNIFLEIEGVEIWRAKVLQPLSTGNSGTHFRMYFEDINSSDPLLAKYVGKDRCDLLIGNFVYRIELKIESSSLLTLTDKVIETIKWSKQ